MCECCIVYGFGWEPYLDDAPLPPDPGGRPNSRPGWVERQRKFWDEALERLAKALAQDKSGRRRPKGEWP